MVSYEIIDIYIDDITKKNGLLLNIMKIKKSIRDYVKILTN